MDSVHYDIINQHASFEPAKEVTVSMRISISDNNNIRDCYYDTLITVFDGAFQMTGGMWEITSVYIPTLSHGENVLELPAASGDIESEAFANNRSLNEVVLPKHMNRVEGHAFLNCFNLNVVYMPETFEYIAEDAFEGCPNVVLICPENSAALDYAREHGYVYLTKDE